MGKKPSNGTPGVPDVTNGPMTPYLVIGTIADTTWRMFVPTVGFTFLGVWLDSALGTKPWLMFLGIIVGAAFAVLLVKKQLADIKRSKQ